MHLTNLQGHGMCALEWLQNRPRPQVTTQRALCAQWQMGLRYLQARCLLPIKCHPWPHAKPLLLCHAYSCSLKEPFAYCACMRCMYMLAQKPCLNAATHAAPQACMQDTGALSQPGNVQYYMATCCSCSSHVGAQMEPLRSMHALTLWWFWSLPLPFLPPSCCFCFCGCCCFCCCCPCPCCCALAPFSPTPSKDEMIKLTGWHADTCRRIMQCSCTSGSIKMLKIADQVSSLHLRMHMTPSHRQTHLFGHVLQLAQLPLFAALLL